MKYKLGSLFDGSGGFPLAGALCGIEPSWASEVEPYPIAVTRERFPKMKHLGDISKINGAEVEPVDVITFGSPCQDLSVAGKRAGLKHEANGDEETTRSGLFMEAVRIIKEMREATHGKYPSFALWENVPGAFSSNKGEDFRVVCEELIKIVEPTAAMPSVPKNGWPYSDSYVGDGWSLAYRVFDAQYWGVPQRRRRIHLILDLRGERAREVLFEREGVRGYFTQGGKAWERITANAEGSTGANDREGETTGAYGVTTKDNGDAFISKERHTALTSGGGQAGQGYPCVLKKKEAVGINGDTTGTIALAPVASTLRAGAGAPKHEQDFVGRLVLEQKEPVGINNDQYLFQPVAYSSDSLSSNSMKSNNPHSGCRQTEIGKTLDCSDPNPSKNQGGIAIVQPVKCYDIGEARLRTPGEYTEKSPTITARCGTGGNNVPVVLEEEPVYCLQGNMIGREDKNGPQGDGVNEDVAFTCNTIDRHAVAYRQGGFADYVEGEVGTLRAAGGDFGGGSKNLICEQKPQYIVRRLTPTECARLQGFADSWGYIAPKEDFTDEEYRFWLDVRNTHAIINDKPVKEYTVKQMLTWYNKLYTDSAEYKMWGNGIALPPALYCMQGILDALNAYTNTGEDSGVTPSEMAGMSGNNQPIICYQAEETYADRLVLDDQTEATITDELTDLSDAPEEIKEEIMENAVKLENMAAEETQAETTNEPTATAFNAIEQLRALAEERKVLAHINTNTPRFEDDVRAIEYAVSVLEAVGL